MDNQNNQRDIKATLKKNWRLFKQSRLGITGLVIVIFFGFLAILLAAVNIFGGFLVTQRMLQMYKKKKK